MTIPSFTGYISPGVYVQDVSTPIVTPVLVPSRVLTLVGPATGYRTAVQSLLISSATATALTYSGAFLTAQSGPPAIPAPVVATASGAVLALGTDYALTAIPDPSGDPTLARATITRVSTSTAIANGQQVFITYSYADGTYFRPQSFTDPQSVINAYGQPFLSAVPAAPNASQVANPLSLAAQVAFANGATTLLCVALNPGDGTFLQQYASAYAKVASQVAATIVVPVFADDLTSSPTTVAALLQTLAQETDAAMWSAYNDGFPRMAIIGLPRNYGEADIPVPTLAASIGSRRTVLAYPEVVQLYNGVTTQVVQASGCYLAVALGAVLSSLPVSTGLTGQVIKGTSGLSPADVARMTPAFMNSLAASGVLVCGLNFSGVLACRQGLTTDMSAQNFQEISLVRQSDSLLLAVSQGLMGSGLIGSPITATTVSTVQEAVIGVLEAAIGASVIQAYSSLSVIQQTYPTGSPTIIAVTFSYAPAIPLNFITVQMSVNLSSGLVAVQSQQNASATGA